ncbi:E3 ubiquitin-protein ligase MARCHF2-like [Oppia nitens]|uniref:E3 ubiquitin-protein ligase MARCHF2-like n=1 Tax=Oppia nitens TaxID=1686743 RepID=UPI0023D97F85|nr:E3 ubiquitin-protein ligase MARCHF2-like [Oppia nitens]
MSSNELFCKICREEDTVFNLINVCFCRGTAANVHFKCLKQWILSSGRIHCLVCKSRYTGIHLIARPKGLLSYINQNKMTIVSHCFYLGIQYYMSYICLEQSLVRTDEIGYNVGSDLLRLMGLFFGIDSSIYSYLIITRGIKDYLQWKNTNFNIDVIKR